MCYRVHLLINSNFQLHFSVVYLDSSYDVSIRNGVLNANFKLDAVIRQ